MKDLNKYQSFEVTGKAINYEDMLISVGYWTYIGKEIRGKALYKNLNNSQTYLFDLETINYIINK